MNGGEVVTSQLLRLFHGTSCLGEVGAKLGKLSPETCANCQTVLREDERSVEKQRGSHTYGMHLP